MPTDPGPAAHPLYLASRESRDTLHVISRVGRRLPTHITALGQALLAELTHEEVDKVLPSTLESYTANSITDRAALHAEIAAVRDRGWAVEREQGTPGVACVAAAVHYRIPATDAIGCSMPAPAATDKEIQRVAKAVMQHTTALATTLRRAGIR
ncbi:IclR family transcriptional regulator [Allorhizocola rhizosphaerae]|uniref:IclR family transcriptional regulator n=1 Tax=Allorhizocola rhizosphaerae TaxID=1872709 RepID=UPI001FE26687|nr:IclR family transcriptional regulator C-terminal domain-containing protein [Allorhizocola rhizosphaerae]